MHRSPRAAIFLGGPAGGSDHRREVQPCALGCEWVLRAVPRCRVHVPAHGGARQSRQGALRRPARGPLAPDPLHGTHCSHAQVYYTIKMPDGREKQTTFAKLSAAPAAVAVPAPAPAPTKQAAQPMAVDTTGEWECAICTLRNLDSDFQCAACETPRPGTGGTVAASSASAALAPTSGIVRAQVRDRMDAMMG